MQLGIKADGASVTVVDLASGEEVEHVVRASLRATPEGVVASMTWHVVGEPAAPAVAGEAPRTIGREAFLGAADEPDPDAPRPRRAL